MKTPSASHASARKTLLRPLKVSITLATIGLMISLAFLAFSAWRSASRLDPLEHHIHYLHKLQQIDVGISKLLVQHLGNQVPPDPSELQSIRSNIEQLQTASGALSEATPQNLQAADDYLKPPIDNPRSNLVGALSLIREINAEESRLQQQTVKNARQSANQEMTVALVALAIIPLFSLALIVWFQRRSFRAVNRLSELLDNVGNLEFSNIRPLSDNDPLTPIYAHYNDMTTRLRDAAKQQSEYTEQLQAQVRAAAETLLRQQDELENGARLAAIGEFSARLAHELRNPISGISMALHNLEIEIEDADHKERITLITEEMDRITRLLNSLLQSRPFLHEEAVTIPAEQLIGDVIKLFGYRLPEHITMTSEIEAGDVFLPRDTVRQILLNLLKNACEAMGDNAGKIVIRFVTDDKNAQLILSDSGPGYPAALLGKGVRPLQSAKPNGAGLGLSIIDHLVRSHGGEMRLDKSELGGAQTTIILPCEGK
ncbi:PAS domain-containing sensor histidine kinase [Thalassospira sp. TSL5-1]|uniref:sensor histidine kinase n=1 Tax=Thalassospira sp. TSL5-1 TaxID=1544451 RepID=UPI00093DAD15|nr:ATP-binding protein [Thalassospira sp. TSL5-1]OKH88896.1 hypothetical protein LF95_02105 [Thalassospira sp. TSL5-1]